MAKLINSEGLIAIDSIEAETDRLKIIKAKEAVDRAIACLNNAHIDTKRFQGSAETELDNSLKMLVSNHMKKISGDSMQGCERLSNYIAETVRGYEERDSAMQSVIMGV